MAGGHQLFSNLVPPAEIMKSDIKKMGIGYQ